MNITRTAVGLAPIVLVARGVAFTIPILIAHLFGVSQDTDAFFYALAWPLVALVLTGNAVGTVMTPVLATVQRAEPRAVGPLLKKIVGFTSVAVMSATALLAAAQPVLLPRLPGFSSRLAPLTATFTLLLVPFAGLVCANVILRAAAEVRGHFRAAATMPVPRAFVTLFTLFVGAPFLHVSILPLALTLGALCEFVLYLLLFRRDGVEVQSSNSPPETHAVLMETARSVSPVLIGQGLLACVLLVDRTFAATLEDGAVSLLDYADRVRLIPQTLFDGTLLPVAFATWSHLRTEEDDTRYPSEVFRTLHWLAGIAAPTLAGLFIARVVVMRWLFERGAFTYSDSLSAASILGWVLPGLWFMMMGALCMRAHVVEGKLLPILWIGAIGLSVKVTANALLSPLFGVEGLMMASTVMYAVLAMLYAYGVSQTWLGGLSARTVARPAAIITGSVLVVLAVELGGIVASATDPRLWVAAAALLGLLAWGNR